MNLQAESLGNQTAAMKCEKMGILLINLAMYKGKYID